VNPTVQLHRGDCLEILPTLAGGSVDAIISDPPYRVKNKSMCIERKNQPRETVGEPWGYSLDWIDAAAALKPTHWIIFSNYFMLGEVHTALSRHADIAAVFVWRKSNSPQMVRPVPRLDCEFIVWAKRPGASNGNMKDFQSLIIDVPMLSTGFGKGERIVACDSLKAIHPCQKPLGIIRPFVRRLFKEPGATILDPYMGTGTTGVATVQFDSNFIGVEIDEGYFRIAECRIARAVERAAIPLLDGVPAIDTQLRISFDDPVGAVET
jgi:DNA modification methylase